ncbi:MAG TPA: DUF559 domain-containing protein [Acidimicrobiales bacterium]|nr:DUF559 domain-containing protein [Acidimicrobiales bacterium]
MVDVDKRVAQRAERQHGVVGRGQARADGMADHVLRRRSDAGRLVRVQPGVYRAAGAPVTWHQRVRAACLAGGEGAVASHRTAARMWGLHETEVVEISVPRRRLPRPQGVIVHRSGDLAPGHATSRGAVPVTNPLRTLVDLGAALPAPLVEDALDRGLAARLVTVAGVEWMLNEVARRGRAGAGVMRSILDDRALGTEPPDGLLEPRMARLLRGTSLPPAEFQWTVLDAQGRFVARVDFAYPSHRLAIEVDGYEKRASPAAMRHDLRRQNALVALGWTVVRFTWVDVVRTPGRVAADITAALDAIRA